MVRVTVLSAVAVAASSGAFGRLTLNTSASVSRVDPEEAAATIETMKQEVAAEAEEAKRAHQQAELSKGLSAATVTAAEAFTLKTDAAREAGKTAYLMSEVGEADSRAKKAVHAIDETISDTQAKMAAAKGLVGNAVQAAVDGTVDKLKEMARQRVLAVLHDFTSIKSTLLLHALPCYSYHHPTKLK